MLLDLHKQPGKGIFLTYQILNCLFVRLPFWTLISVVPALRPRRSWSLGKCIRVRFISWVFPVSQRYVASASYSLPTSVPNHLHIADSAA
jgi:hypothetical protein